MLPFTTTTVTIEHKVPGSVKYEGPAYEPGTEAPGVVSNLTGSGRYTAGNAQTVTARLHVDLGAGVLIGDRVTDQANGQVYEVIDSVTRYEFGIDYQVCGLIRFEGQSL